ncbi:MAG: DEAD/DEAH box helicase [Ignavibacteria bacterium]|nr:DEAD/DEAH box helicase [Ignavibacteria bacterium]
MSEFTNEIKEIFSPDGLLNKLEGFEYRKEQQQMAVSIANSLETGVHNIIEAPTGVGKSLAYLVPSILFALKNERKAIISTCTINLQEQLINKDLPALAKILPVEFKFEILKGRNNYICSKRLSKAMIEKSSLFMTSEQQVLHKIYDFSNKEGKGTRQDIPFAVDDNVWSEIFAEEGVCTQKSCGGTDTNCYYQQAKQKMKDADLLVLNHHLFFTLFGFYERDAEGYLYFNDFVIFDEAHKAEQIAAERVSPSVSKEQIRFWLNKLYNPRSGKGFFSLKQADRLKKTIEFVYQDNEHFFKMLHLHVNEKYSNQSHKSAIRIKESVQLGDELLNSLLELTIELKKSTPLAKNDIEEDEIKNYFTKFTRIRNNLIFFLEQKSEKYVYWIEYKGRARNNIDLCISPIDMAEYFRGNIFANNRLCAMTSATLSTNQNLEFFKNTIGANNIQGEIIESPFNFSRQMKIHVYKNIPEPEKSVKQKISDLLNESNYEKILNEKIKECIEMTSGGALVLFTSNKLLKNIYHKLLEDLLGKGINLYAQHNGMPNNRILQEFRKDENSVLLGVDSFWMGVDIPGHSLRNVIVTKLPFEVPDHPVIEAKLEFILNNGGNPFLDYSLPTAILKFKQGIGRLIRNRNDEGIICILDSRIINKPYGKHFINSLPECEIVIESEN